MPELQWTRTRPCATRALSMKSTMRCRAARKFPPSPFLSVQEMWQYNKSSSKKFSVSTAMFRTCVMRLLRKAMRSDAIARPPIKISRLSRVHPNSSAFAADVGLALSSAEFGRSANTARSKKPGTMGAIRRRASDGRSGRGPSKDDSDDASEWSSSCMDVDMVFGESASSDRMGCSNIIVWRPQRRQRWFGRVPGQRPFEGDRRLL